ncbi:sulfatase [Verrucomicrobium spinosum]|uniref:sulfatase n=1 Tax=Verrucomicrobium spinosum TaxID=2736 RepID=UPI0018DC69A0|nr:sulfatase [Verrucomicrobium spinosum]
MKFPAPFMALFVFVSSISAADKSRPNVLFIAVDDLRPEFGAYGSKIVKSPHLDRLAASGVTFQHAYCQQAVCSPSRSSLLTGARPDTTQVYDLVRHFRKSLPDVVTLPQHFKNQGYYVQGMGKLYHSGLDDPASWSVPWTKPQLPHGVYGLPENQNLGKKLTAEARAAGKKPNAARRGPAFESSDSPDNAFHDGALADMAVAALREASAKNQPFWLGVGFIRPHLPFVAPKKYWDLYDPAQIELAPNPQPARDAPPYAVTNFGELRNYAGIPQQGPIPDALARQLKHGYYAAISYMDAQVGRLLDELDRLGLRNNTIIVLWGDHGWKLGEHGSWCKHSTVENDTNAPLLVSVPGLKSAGQKTAALVEFVDIYPSLAELCGLPLPAHLEGTSFVPVLNEPSRAWKSAAFSQYPRGAKEAGVAVMGYSMRTEKYRLTRWVDRTDASKVVALELYDHQTDPQENINLAADPAKADLVKQLSAQAEQGWQAAKPKG